MPGDIQTKLQKLPSVDKILQSPLLQRQLEISPRRVVVDVVRETLTRTRQKMLSGILQGPQANPMDLIVRESLSAIADFMKVYYRRVVNATGIVLHTGLGRAVIPPTAMQQLQQEISGYSLLQVSIEDGKRSRRDEHVEKLLMALTGAEAATVVNNNAAATAIVLNTIAAGKEVIVSRGQLVEIGGSYRLPDVMAFSGAKLVEVGTTNKTHLKDYENAITENTAAILRVHPSNYKIKGFTSEVPLGEMVALAHAKGLVLFDDVGAGSLIDFSKYGFEKEPTLLESIKEGADVVTSSGDKLIGASQAGIILGKADIIAMIRKNQFARIVRVDKMTLTVLEATLKLFFDEQKALQEVPTLRMLLKTCESITKQARQIAAKIRSLNLACRVELADGFSQTGSGSLPDQNLKTKLVTLQPDKISSSELASRLRHHKVPVFARIQEDRVLIDPRTLLEGDAQIIIEALGEILETAQ